MGWQLEPVEGQHETKGGAGHGRDPMGEAGVEDTRRDDESEFVKRLPQS